MLTLGGQILLSGPGQSATTRPGVVEIDHEQIVGVEFGPISPSVDVGSENTLICPGLIDTHLHLPQFDSIGAAGMRLLPWLSEVIFPAEIRWNDIAFAKSMIKRVANQCLAVGTTGICAYATVSHEATIAALLAFREIGFRGVIGQMMMDRDAPAALLRSTDQLVDEVGRTLNQFPAGERMAAAITPRFALSCSDRLMDQAGELAASGMAIVQTHLAETTAECRAVDERFGGKSYVQVYQDAGLLNHNSVLGHGIHLDGLAQQRLAESGAKIAHCPTANSFLGSGTMNRDSHLNAGIPITLGSDIGAGFERSMVRVGRAMIDAAIRMAANTDGTLDDFRQIPSAADAWHQITAGNADALGWVDVGRIRPGASADVLVIDPDIPWRETRCPLSTLMFAWDDRWISRTFLRGRVQYACGHADPPASP
jgi:guanine deaminase